MLGNLGKDEQCRKGQKVRLKEQACSQHLNLKHYGCIIKFYRTE